MGLAAGEAVRLEGRLEGRTAQACIPVPLGQTPAKEPLWTAAKGVRPSILTNPCGLRQVQTNSQLPCHASDLRAGEGRPGVQAAEALRSQGIFLGQGRCYC